MKENAKIIKINVDLYWLFAVYYIVRFEIVRGWVTGHTEMTNDLQSFLKEMWE